MGLSLFYLRSPDLRPVFQERNYGDKKGLGLRLFSYANAVWRCMTLTPDNEWLVSGH